MPGLSAELSLITLHWFLTAFASVVPVRLLLRLWDLLFYDGSRVLFQTTLGMLRLKVPLHPVPHPRLGTPGARRSFPAPPLGDPVAPPENPGVVWGLLVLSSSSKEVTRAWGWGWRSASGPDACQ